MSSEGIPMSPQEVGKTMNVADALLKNPAAVPDALRQILREAMEGCIRQMQFRPDPESGRAAVFIPGSLEAARVVGVVSSMTTTQREQFLGTLVRHQLLALQGLGDMGLNRRSDEVCMEEILVNTGMKGTTLERASDLVQGFMKGVLEVCAGQDMTALRKVLSADGFAPRLRGGGTDYVARGAYVGQVFERSLGTEGHGDFVRACTPILRNLGIDLHKKLSHVLDRVFIGDRNRWIWDQHSASSLIEFVHEMGCTWVLGEQVLRQHLSLPGHVEKNTDPMVSRIVGRMITASMTEALALRFLHKRYPGMFIEPGHDPNIGKRLGYIEYALKAVMNMRRTMWMNDVILDGIAEILGSLCTKLHQLQARKSPWSRDVTNPPVSSEFLGWLHVSWIAGSEDEQSCCTWTIHDEGGVHFGRTLECAGVAGAEIPILRFTAGSTEDTMWGDHSFVPLREVIPPGTVFAKELAHTTKASGGQYAGIAEELEEFATVQIARNLEIPVRFVSLFEDPFCVFTKEEAERMQGNSYETIPFSVMPISTHIILESAGYPLPRDPRNLQPLPASSLMMLPIEGGHEDWMEPMVPVDAQPVGTH